MTHRRHEAYERFIEYFTTEHEPPMTQEQAEILADKIGRHALLCVESAEWLQREVDSVDEFNAAAAEFDRWAIAREMTVPGEGWGNGLGRPLEA